MKRVVGVGILLNIIALSCLAKMASPAFAATNRASAATHAQASINIARTASRELQALPTRRHPRQNNQSFVGFSEFGRTANYWGITRTILAIRASTGATFRIMVPTEGIL